MGLQEDRAHSRPDRFPCQLEIIKAARIHIR